MSADVVVTRREAAAQQRPPLLVLEPLAAVLDAHGLGSGPLTAEPIGDGHSNVTFAVRRDGADVVLRRPPRPPYPRSAHDVLREARLLARLHAAGVRVPAILAVCDDDEVIGAPFFVMERVDGHVVTAELPADLATETAGGEIADQLVDALAELHEVDVERAGLTGLGRPTGYLERQLHRFRTIWEERRTRELPEVDEVGDWLAKRRPDQSGATVVHGDFRLGNVMLAPTAPPRIAAVLDWEMATIGDPLADLGYLVASWAEPGDEETPILELSAVTRSDGFPGRDAVKERYAARTGRDVADLRWYEVLAMWKSAVFLEASYARLQEGTTDDPYFARLGAGVPALGRAARERAFGRA